jgi:hypothetical protein
MTPSCIFECSAGRQVSVVIPYAASNADAPWNHT